MSVFHFKYFSIHQSRSALKVGTDSMVLGTLINCATKTCGLDIGSGTGVLALMIAQKNTLIDLDAIELDNQSAMDCKVNFENSSWADRLNLIEANFLNYSFTKKYDLIFSNPPFFENSLENEKQNKTMARHTKSLPFNDLFEKVSALLKEDGSFWIILPFAAENKVSEIAESNGLLICDSWIIEGKPQQPVRIVLHFQKLTQQKDSKIISKIFQIRNSDGCYSEQYKNATSEFHNKKIE